MNLKKLKTICWILVYLIIALPIYTASVFAETSDKTKPAVTGVSYSPKYPTSQSSIDFTLNVTESSELTLTVDASAVSSEKFPKTASCAKQWEDNKWSCAIPVEKIKEGYLEKNIYFIANDSAGNSIKYPFSVKIYKLEKSKTPNSYSVSSVETIPDKIDRNIASQISLNLFLVPTIKANSGDTEILGKSVECGSLSYYLAESPYIMNEDSSNPYIVLKFSNNIANIQNNSITIGCNLILNVKKSNEIYANPEYETIKTDIELYNNALGNADENIEKKLQSIQNEIDDIQDDINSKEKTVKVFGTICGTAKTLGEINAVLQGIKAIVQVASCAIIVPSFGMSKETWESACNVFSFFHKFVNDYIWPASIVPLPPYDDWIGHILKFSCMIFYECAVCDFGAWLQVGVDVGTGFAQGWTTVSKNNNPSQSDSHETAIDIGSPPSNLWERIKFETNKITGGAVSSQDKENEKSSWYKSGEPTKLQKGISSDNWLYNPYKSEHYAANCMCLPAIVYNMKKDQQIKCMYRNCLEHHLNTGIPIEECDRAYKERECLYVESAQWKLHGGLGGFFSRLGELILRNLPFIALGAGYLAVCWKVIKAPPPFCATTPCDGIASLSTWCTVWGSALEIMQMVNVFSSGFGYNNYDQELQGEDYCSGSGY